MRKSPVTELLLYIDCKVTDIWTDKENDELDWKDFESMREQAFAEYMGWDELNEEVSKK